MKRSRWPEVEEEVLSFLRSVPKTNNIVLVSISVVIGSSIQVVYNVSHPSLVEQRSQQV